jgi:hypothetical protein
MMTHEERLDRLERIARLTVRAGLRARREMRQQDDKITIMIDAQIKNEERFSNEMHQQDDKITIMIDAQIKNEERFAKLAQAQTELAISQKRTDGRLDALIDIVREGRNGSAGSNK